MTPLNDNPILVIGATGRQGGASARHLLETGWRVRALVRDPAAPAARSLAERGAEFVHGDLDDPESIARAVWGTYGVHSVQAYMPKDPDREVRQGAAVIDAAKAAGVQACPRPSFGQPTSWTTSRSCGRGLWVGPGRCRSRPTGSCR